MKRTIAFLASIPSVLAHETGGVRVEHVSVLEEFWHYLFTNGKWIFGVLFVLAVIAFVYWTRSQR